MLLISLLSRLITSSGQPRSVKWTTVRSCEVGRSQTKYSHAKEKEGGFLEPDNAPN